jgi:TRAP-type mannitol/chloroaromatic compound transport system permease large subunit
VTSNGGLIFLMAFLFLFLGYMGVPVAFALIGAVLVVTAFTPVSLASMMAQLFNGMDTEALLAVPFFLLVGDLMTSANVTGRMITVSQTMVGYLRGGRFNLYSNSERLAPACAAHGNPGILGREGMDVLPEKMSFPN